MQFLGGGRIIRGQTNNYFWLKLGVGEYLEGRIFRGNTVISLYPHTWMSKVGWEYCLDSSTMLSVLGGWTVCIGQYELVIV